MPSAAVLFIVVVGPSDIGLCLTGSLHYSIAGIEQSMKYFILSERFLIQVPGRLLILSKQERTVKRCTQF